MLRVANAGGSGTTVDSIVDPAGDRLGTRVGTTVAWLLPDLHGSVAAGLAQDQAAVTDALRYDGYGITAATWPTGGSAASTTWKYQGRLDLSPTATSLYDFAARDYAPGLGTFTSLDSVLGSAQNPWQLNRFLYAAANPATLIDPDGHCVPVAAAAGPGGVLVAALTCGPEIAVGAIEALEVVWGAALFIGAGAAAVVNCSGCAYDQSPSAPWNQPGFIGARPIPRPVARPSTSLPSTLTIPAPTLAPTPAPGSDPHLMKGDPTHVGPPVTARVPDLTLPGNDNYPLPPPRGCGASRACRVVTALLAIVLGGSPVLSGLTGHQLAEGEGANDLHNEGNRARRPIPHPVLRSPTLLPRGASTVFRQTL